MMATFRCRDVVSGDYHDYDGSTPCVLTNGDEGESQVWPLDSREIDVSFWHELDDERYAYVLDPESQGLDTGPDNYIWWLTERYLDKK